MPSNHLILCRPLLLPPSIFPSIRVFFNESVVRIRWPKYWRFSFNISLSNEHSGLISFRMDWLDLFAVQGTLKSLLQHHSSKASVHLTGAGSKAVAPVHLLGTGRRGLRLRTAIGVGHAAAGQNCFINHHAFYYLFFPLSVNSLG